MGERGLVLTITKLADSLSAAGHDSVTLSLHLSSTGRLERLRNFRRTITLHPTKYITTKRYRVLVLVFVGERGLEPPCLAAPAPKAGVSTNFTTRPSSGEEYTMTQEFFLLQ